MSTGQDGDRQELVLDLTMAKFEMTMTPEGVFAGDPPQLVTYRDDDGLVPGLYVGDPPRLLAAAKGVRTQAGPIRPIGAVAPGPDERTESIALYGSVWEAQLAEPIVNDLLAAKELVEREDALTFDPDGHTRATVPLQTHRQVRAERDAARAVRAQREAELLALKGPCSVRSTTMTDPSTGARVAGYCRLHFAHSGPCDIVPKGAE